MFPVTPPEKNRIFMILSVTPPKIGSGIKVRSGVSLRSKWGFRGPFPVYSTLLIPNTSLLCTYPEYFYHPIKVKLFWGKKNVV